MHKKSNKLLYSMVLYLLVLLTGSSILHAQNPATINSVLEGSVLDEVTNEPLDGANVIIEGVTNQTTTNSKGQFILRTGQKFPYNIVVTFVGYEKKTVLATGSPVSVRLKPTNNNLDDVVVVGYGTQKRREVNGAVSKLSTADFNKGASVSSIDQLIQGAAAGVNIQQTSAEPGGGVNVRIRGINSINASSSPLYVIDGVPIDNSNNLSGSSGSGFASNLNPKNPISSINPSDIESVEVLKDASATAIYGSRGANGVILITTKKGKAGKTKVTLDYNTGVQSIAKKIDVLSASEYIKAINELAVARGNTIVFTKEDSLRIGNGTDWQNEIVRQAPLHNGSVTFSGGSEAFNYFTSLNYLNQQGIVKNTAMDRVGARLNLGSRFSEHGTMGVNLNVSRIKDRNFVDGNSINESAGPVNTALLYDPTEAIYNEDGTYTQSSFLTINNPLSVLNGVSSINISNRTTGNIFVEYEILRGLKMKINGGADLLSQRRDLYSNRATIYGKSQNGIANIATIERSNILGEYTINYKKELTFKSTIEALAGITYQYFQTRQFAGSISGFPSDDLETNNLGLGDIATAGLSSYKGDNKLLSYLGRVNYALDKKYYLTASIRADGSSRFGENKKFGYFPSVAAGWLLSGEDFLPSLFDYLKLRASWGLTGNQDIGNYNSISTYGTGAKFVTGDNISTGTSPSRIANPDLKWESTEQTNIGFDATVLNHRLDISADYFIKNTKDMLVSLPIPTASGYSSILTNIGSIQNKGLEIFIKGKLIDKRDFSWTSSLNFSKIVNKVVDLGSIANIITGNASNIGNVAIITKGEPAFAYYGYKVTGIFKNQEEVDNSAQPLSRPGFPIFEDVNKDGQINTADQQIIGTPFPDFTYGWQNSVTYRNMGISFLLQGQEGGSILNGNILESMYPSNNRRNMLAETVLNRWTPDNMNAKWPSATSPTAYGGGKVNTLALQSASYARLKYIQVYYNLPVKPGAIKSVSVNASAQNLITFTKYIGYDPEANTFGNSNAKIDLNSYPLARVWSLGVNLSF
ncbi:SusC/RagA family TonB-linked outer membrane protein [Niabella aquatica]